MKKIKATKTMRHADIYPHLPQYSMVDGEEYEVPEHIANQVCAAGAGYLLDELKPAPEEETKVIQPEASSEVKEEKAEPPNKRRGKASKNQSKGD